MSIEAEQNIKESWQQADLLTNIRVKLWHIFSLATVWFTVFVR